MLICKYRLSGGIIWKGKYVVNVEYGNRWMDITKRKTVNMEDNQSVENVKKNITKNGEKIILIITNNGKRITKNTKNIRKNITKNGERIILNMVNDGKRITKNIIKNILKTI
jgi:hypothetical protein